MNHTVTVAWEFWPQLAVETDTEMSGLHVDDDICILKEQFLLRLLHKIKVDNKQLTFKELAVLNLIQNILRSDI